MREFSRVFEVDAPAERVWTHMRDVERWKEWTASIRDVRIFGGGPLQLGRRALVRQPKLPPAVWKVTELDDTGRHFTWVSVAPGIRVTGRHEVAAQGRVSRASLSLAYEGAFGGWMARLLQNITEHYLDLEANGLKRRSEGPA